VSLSTAPEFLIHRTRTPKPKRIPMMKVLTRLGLAALLIVFGPSDAQTASHPTGTTAGTVTVVIEMNLTSPGEPEAALVALRDMRAMVRTRPGFLSDELLRNFNGANVPAYVHVSRWTTMAYWSAVFLSPTFGKLSAHGNQHYTVTASAFVPVE
jgi:heme-degrading monooxygenase HmoA